MTKKNFFWIMDRCSPHPGFVFVRSAEYTNSTILMQFQGKIARKDCYGKPICGGLKGQVVIHQMNHRISDTKKQDNLFEKYKRWYQEWLKKYRS